jgi:hypothetical protein
MTRPARPRNQPPIVLQLGPIPDGPLDACARSLASIAVDKALKELGLDSGPTFDDTVGNQHKEAPVGVSPPTEAKEQVL